ncbi:hypothetical protein MHU86_24713 [Fragilaria crotonensis]|nr:hypothetical protein MHU86_24713 [Fragilaria crotonensis]
MNDAGKAFLPSSTWTGAKEGYYFGTTIELGTGYYLDVNATAADTSASASIVIQQKESSSNGNKRKRNITIDESQNRIQSIPSRFHDHFLDIEVEKMCLQHLDESIHFRRVDLVVRKVPKRRRQGGYHKFATDQTRHSMLLEYHQSQHFARPLNWSTT